MSQESMKKVSRRKFVALTGGALIASAFLAACGDNNTPTPISVTLAPSSGPTSTGVAATSSPSGVTLEYWAWILGSKDAVDLWNQTHTNFKVNYTQTTAGVPHYNRVKAAVAAGSGGPDLAQVGLEFVSSLVVEGVLQPITKEVAAYKDTFIDWTIQEVTLGGDIYAIPQDIGPMAMFYRKDIFDQYGIPVPKTWDEYKAAGEKIHAADLTRYIAHFAPAEVFQFAGYAWGNKAKWFDIKGDAWRVTINSAETKKVADFWQDLITRKLVKVEADFNAAWYKDLLDGTIVTWMGGIWVTGILSSNVAGAAGKWAVAYLPQWTAGSKAAGNWGGSSTAVVKGSKHIAEAVEFAAWLNSDPGPVGAMIKAQNILPATRDIGSFPVLKQPVPYLGGQAVSDLFTEAAANIDPSWTWGPTMYDVYNDIGDQFTAATNGGSGTGTLSAALDRVQAKTVAALQSMGLEVAQ